MDLLGEYIPTNRHCLICGMTGTGKSLLAEYYLRGYKYVVKLDTKDEYDERKSEGKSPWTGLTENKDFTMVRRFEDLDDVETDKIIYVPPYEEQTPETFDMFFNWIFARGNTIMWIDELMSIGSVNSFPKGLGRLMQQGRSKNIGVWSCSQRPSSIPSCVPANSTYFFIFNLMLPQDRKRIVETTGIPTMNEIPNGHNFWYYKMGQTQAIKCCLQL